MMISLVLKHVDCFMCYFLCVAVSMSGAAMSMFSAPNMVPVVAGGENFLCKSHLLLVTLMDRHSVHVVLLYTLSLINTHPMQ